MRGWAILRIVAALLLVAIVGTMFWYISPVKALDIAIEEPEDNTLGKTIEFEVVVEITESTMMPLESIDLYIYNGDDRGAATSIVTCLDLPVGNGETKNYTSTETGGGAVEVYCENTAAWEYGYGEGYIEWEGYTYPGGGYGYGYGSGPATLTYTVSWTSPRWSAGDYTIEMLVTGTSGDEFSEKLSEVRLVRSGGGGGGGGGDGDTTPPTISEITVANVTKTSADISWKTQELSSSQVEYWASAHEFSDLDETNVINHLVILTGLTPGTTYTFKVISVDISDNKAESEEATFTTDGTPATFVIKNLEIVPGEVEIGDNVSISVVVQNTGDAIGVYTVTLTLEDQAVATKQVTVVGGAEQEAKFTVTAEEAGTYSVGVDGLSGSFDVKAAPTPTPTPTATPTPTPPPDGGEPNWWLIGGIIAGLVALAVVIWLTVIRPRTMD